jgi:hypothetical protein
MVSAGEIAHVVYEAEPAGVPRAAWVEARMLDLRRGWTDAMPIPEVAVESRQFLAIPGLADQRFQDVEGFEIIGYLATCGEAYLMALEPLECHSEGTFACADLQ